jgi:hypothetical protein
MKDFFSWLDGKKTYLFGILALTNAFLGTQGLYDQTTMAYIQAVLTLLAGGAEYTTIKLGARL